MLRFVRGETKRILGFHFGLLLAESICICAFVIEVRRAVGGNSLSWAYVFEWPIFSAYAVYMWRKLIKEERQPSDDNANDVAVPDDPALVAYNEYLSRVHRNLDDDGPPSS